MNKFRAAVASMRLRTLPLSTGGVLLGILLATADFKVDVWTSSTAPTRRTGRARSTA